MLEENEVIMLPGVEAIDILKEIEFMLISLHKIGSAYAKPKGEKMSDDEYVSYCKETTRFVDESNVLDRLVFIRRKISDKFNDDLGDDDMDDIERGMKDIIFWPFD